MVPSSGSSASPSISATMASGVSMSSMLSSVPYEHGVGVHAARPGGRLRLSAGGRVLTRVGHGVAECLLVLDRVERLELVHGGLSLYVHHPPPFRTLPRWCCDC